VENPWLAIDASTAPPERARELRAAWERFIQAGDSPSVRAPIADSWRRSHDAGVDPSRPGIAPVLEGTDETAARWDVHPLARLTALFEECAAAVPDEAGNLLVVSDHQGVLLWIQGAPRIRHDAADAMNFAEGTLWSEGGTGTNAIGTALAADHAVQVFAAEHFNEVVQEWTCAAAPIHDPETGELLGVVDLTSRMTQAHPYSLALAVSTARAAEAQLRLDMHERDTRLRARYEQRVKQGGDARALLTPRGRVLMQHPRAWLPGTPVALPPGGGELVLPTGDAAFAEPVGDDDAFLVRAIRERSSRSRPVLRLSLLNRDRAAADADGTSLAPRRRHSEILALLWASPDGLTTEELGADLYGDTAKASSVRGEMARLRKLLGTWISSEPYRIRGDVDCDVGRVQELLRRGEVTRAAEEYQGPLLPHSEAPGVVRERDSLERWIRHAVMTADDREALWAWLQTPAGRDDLPAWKALLPHLDFRDPRRSRAAARVAHLRNALATG
jgi:GAF domain